MVLQKPKRHLVAIVVNSTDLPTRKSQHNILNTQHSTCSTTQDPNSSQSTPVHLSHTHSSTQQPKLTHACTTPGAQHCNCRCLSLMSVIAVGNQIDCTHRPSKCLYSHIQQTSASVPKCYQNTERRNMSYVIIYTVICCNYSA